MHVLKSCTKKKTGKPKTKNLGFARIVVLYIFDIVVQI